MKKNKKFIFAQIILFFVLFYCLYQIYQKEKILNNHIAIFEWHWPSQHTDNQTSQALLNKCKKVSSHCKTSSIHILSASFDKSGRLIEHGFDSKTKLLENWDSVFLTYRFEKLTDPRFVGERILSDISVLNRTNTKLTGIEFDYDSPSHKLYEYIKWLESFKKLGIDYPLWVTGLITWQADNPYDTSILTRTVDAVTFQLYQPDNMVIPSQNFLEFILKQNNIYIGLYCFNEKLLSFVLSALGPENNVSLGIFNNTACPASFGK